MPSFPTMQLQKGYATAKARLLGDESICEENRNIFAKFFDYQEYRLKRINRLAELDDATYKTLLFYVSRLRTVNRWFGNKPWKDLTKGDIKRIYDGVEDGTIKKLSGAPFKGSDTYYDRILCGKPFELAGKEKLAKAVMEFRPPPKPGEVRFVKEDTFRKLVDVVIQPRHKALLWLAWDIGENVGALLQLRKRSFTRTVSEYTNEPEYSVALLQEILKRSRRARTETTNYNETVELVDLVLRDLQDDELVFEFSMRMASKVLDRATRITGVRCKPEGQKVTLKDLRSSMACDLLSKGWTTDEVNRRLGHKPSSREIDKYVNWLALDGRQPKRKFHEHQVSQLTQEIDQLKKGEKLSGERQRSLQEQVDGLRKELETRNVLTREAVIQLIERFQLR